MPENIDEIELKARLDLIETMIAQGRRTTGSWGWSFVLWGIAYYVAIAWSAAGSANLAWPVTMVAASVLTVAISGRKRRAQPKTATGRAIGSLWAAMGISLFLLMLSLGLSGRLEVQSGMAIVGSALGLVDLASSIILKWKMQFACAVVWLASVEVACFGTLLQGEITFVVAIFFCQIIFGIYAMISDARNRAPGSAVHA